MILQGTTSRAARVDAPARDASGVRVWLFAVAALIFAMVLVGGATRLTESGLSITQWKPVTGVIPPLSDADWRDEFARYRQIPQFAELNPDMTLDGFKTIFWWEWSHRLLARIIGAAFVAPALWFWLSGRLKGAVGRQVAIATGLLALEPIVGWWMVSSGLSERTEVAQERLAMHLLIAAATFGVLIYAGVGLRRRRPNGASARSGLAAAGFAALVFVQLGLGALVAGLRAGLVYNSWPLMDGRWIPQRSVWAVAMAALDRRRCDDRAIRSSDRRLWRRSLCARAGVFRVARRAGNGARAAGLGAGGARAGAGGAGRGHAAVRRADRLGPGAPGARVDLVRDGDGACGRDEGGTRRRCGAAPASCWRMNRG